MRIDRKFAPARLNPGVGRVRGASSAVVSVEGRAGGRATKAGRFRPDYRATPPGLVDLMGSWFHAAHVLIIGQARHFVSVFCPCLASLGQPRPNVGQAWPTPQVLVEVGQTSANVGRHWSTVGASMCRPELTNFESLYVGTQYLVHHGALRFIMVSAHRWLDWCAQRASVERAAVRMGLLSPCFKNGKLSNGENSTKAYVVIVEATCVLWTPPG